MDRNSNIGFAIVGTGAIADNHARAISLTFGAELRAVYNRSPRKAEVFAKKHGAELEASLDALLAREDIDVVCVTTPSGAHAEIAIPALESKKHVLCEKPLEINIERITAMLRAARSNGQILAAVFQSRLGRGVDILRRAIEEGRFGRLTLCSAYIKWWRSQEYYDEGGWRGTWDMDGGGALMNQGIHCVDLLQWLVGMPVRVGAVADTLIHDGIEVEDTVAASLQFPNGALGVIEAATSCAPGFRRRIEICGQRGSAFLEDDNITFWKFDEERPEDEKIRSIEDNAGFKSGVADPRAIGREGHRLQVEDLVNAIRENREPRIPGSEAYNAVAIVQAIYESAMKKQFIEL